MSKVLSEECAEIRVAVGRCNAEDVVGMCKDLCGGRDVSVDAKPRNVVV